MGGTSTGRAISSTTFVRDAASLNLESREPKGTSSSNCVGSPPCPGTPQTGPGGGTTADGGSTGGCSTMGGSTGGGSTTGGVSSPPRRMN